MKKLLLVIGILLVVGLAYVHWILPGQAESSMNVVIPHQPYSISDEARRLHETLFVADLHSDSLLWKRNLLKRSDVGQMDLPRLREGNVALQVFSATTKSPKGQNYSSNSAESDQITLLAVASLWPIRTWNSIYERAVFQLQKLQKLADTGEFLLVLNREDLESLYQRRTGGEDVVGAIYLIEGAHPLEGELDNLDRLFDQGLRIAGLTHFFDNELGGSLHGLSGEGLTVFGRQVIRRANELGVIVDIAHASPQMVEDVLESSTAPTILSHGGMAGQCNTPRNLSDDLMKEFAAKGGLLGVGYWDAAICDPTPEGIVAAIRYAIDLMGEDHVALGSDYDGTVAVPVDTSAQIRIHRDRDPQSHG